MADGMMVTAELVDGQIWLATSTIDRDRVREIPGCNFDPRTSRWHVPISWAALHMLANQFGNRFMPSDEIVQWGVREYQERVSPSLQLRNLEDYYGDEDLYTFQRAGVGFLWYSQQAILGDEMGAGKTIQTARYLEKLHQQGRNPFPALIVCPNSMRSRWKMELEEWCHVKDLKIQVVANGAVNGRKSLKEPADIYLINWEALRVHSRLAPYGSISLSEKERQPKTLNEMEFRTVIADEAHHAKDPQAKQTRALWQVGHQPTVEFRDALTGTVIANDVGDLWSLLHFLEPREFPTKTAFMDRYALMSYNMWGGLDVIGINPAHRDEFFAIVDARFRRMPKALVLRHLPPIVRITRDTEMGAKQRKAYHEMEEGMISQMDDGTMVMATNSLTKNTRLVQFSSAYATVDADNNVRLTEPSNKLDELEEFMAEVGWKFGKKEKHPVFGEPLIVFAASRQLLELGSARLTNYQIPHGLIVGGMTDAERDEAIDYFQEGRLPLILVNIKAGGEGLTLTRSRFMLFLQRSWSMIENIQAEGRGHRIGSEVHDKITIVDFVTPGTVEEQQIDRIAQKMKRLEEINRDVQRLAEAGHRNELLEREAHNIMTSEV